MSLPKPAKTKRLQTFHSVSLHPVVVVVVAGPAVLLASVVGVGVVVIVPKVVAVEATALPSNSAYIHRNDQETLDKHPLGRRRKSLLSKTGPEQNSPRSAQLSPLPPTNTHSKQ